MNKIIMIGESGAGKTLLKRLFEERDFYCIDNLPFDTIDYMTEKLSNIENLFISIGIINYNDEIKQFDIDKILELKEKGFKLIYIQASTECLVSRYKETRRKHPLGKELLKAIQEEKKILASFKEISDLIIDTTKKDIKVMNESLDTLLKNKISFKVNFLAYGIKYGDVQGADLVFDVRFLKNPHYKEELRILTGMDKKIRDYVMDSPISKEYFEKIVDMLNFVLKEFKEEGRSIVTIAIGCTGGKHRSVTFAKLLNDHFSSEFETNLIIRDNNE